MTDEELEAVTSPEHYSYRTAPAHRGGGLTVAEVEEPQLEHVCGKCRQPITNRGGAWCPNNLRDVEAAAEPYREWEAAQVEREIDRQRGWEW